MLGNKDLRASEDVEKLLIRATVFFFLTLPLGFFTIKTVSFICVEIRI